MPDAPSLEPDGVTIGRVRFDFRAMTAVGPEGALELTPHDILVCKVLTLRRGSSAEAEVSLPLRPRGEILATSIEGLLGVRAQGRRSAFPA